jgi:hypothetical protein
MEEKNSKRVTLKKIISEWLEGKKHHLDKSLIYINQITI